MYHKYTKDEKFTLIYFIMFIKYIFNNFLFYIIVCYKYVPNIKMLRENRRYCSKFSLFENLLQLLGLKKYFEENLMLMKFTIVLEIYKYVKYI